MGREIGHIQKRILTALKNIDSKWISRGGGDHWYQERWVSMNLLILAVYNKPMNPRARRGKDYSHNEHRRVWESVKGLEKRGLVETRIEKIKGSGIKARYAGLQRWMEVRVK